MKQLAFNVDVTGLPEALVQDLEKQALAIFEQAKADMPISFVDRVTRALYELPERDVADVDINMLISSLKSQLQQHFDRLYFIDTISDEARNCINWELEIFDAEELEQQLGKVLNQFFS